MKRIIKFKNRNMFRLGIGILFSRQQCSLLLNLAKSITVNEFFQTDQKLDRRRSHQCG